jgi:predicted RNA-binding protein
VSGLNNFIVGEDFVDNRTAAQGAINGYQFTTFTDATNVYILRHQTNGGNISNAGGLVSTYRILVTYIP